MSESQNSVSEESNDESSDVVTLTLNEVVDMENAMMEDAVAVLGAANDKNCSYAEGYLKRQALYSCLTCIPEAKVDYQKGAGICLACSYHCHEGHELVELYTKRNFRCDCGNKKFTNNGKCNLYASKLDYNEHNQYNQNFGGVYCECKRPYPDPDGSDSDEMIQCIICEDWYHSKHLGVDIESSNGNSFAEMVCKSCVEKHDFLLHYDFLTAPSAKTEKDEEKKPEETEKEEVSVDVSNDTTCKKPNEKSTRVESKFYSELLWRKQLCKCPDCTKIYKEQKVLFLLDSEDPVQIYEDKGKQKATELIENQNKQFFGNMDRFQIGEIAAGYNDLKENLSEFFGTFAKNKRVIRQEDVKEFFDGMNARKKQKTVPFHCQ